MSLQDMRCDECGNVAYSLSVRVKEKLYCSNCWDKKLHLEEDTDCRCPAHVEAEASAAEARYDAKSDK
jgi:hypothetical protein